MLKFCDAIDSFKQKKTQKNYHLRKHELKIKNKFKKNETIDKKKNSFD